MALESGSRLGPYEIDAPAGAGGMGEVYRARDTRLDRTVAIKVLPSHLSDNEDLRERFEREARAVSSLNHPHICTLHDIGREDGVDFLVMEYLEGETLSDLLKKRALPLQQALRYGIQIADALDKAHQQGIVHRDLKPGNIMLTPSGAKLLDFGLAKLQKSGAPQEPDLSSIATEAKPLTEHGAILGTFQYMAPEQLEGEEADARTDIFAFGAVLYEMVTGRKAFEGKSQASLIAAILEREPERLSAMEPTSPPALERVLGKCLAKERSERWASAHELKEILQWIADGAFSGEAEKAATPSKSSSPWLWAVAGLALVAALVAAVGAWWRPPPEPQPVGRFAVSLSRSSQLRVSGTRIDLTISPNGQYIAYTGGEGELYIRRLNEIEAAPISGSGTVGAQSPFFSPNSEWVAYQSQGELRKISVYGGASITLCDAPGPLRGASWGPDDTIVFATDDPSSGLLRVSDAGGDPEILTTPDGGDHLRPEFLPDGRSVLFDIRSGANNRVALLSLDTGEYEDLLPEGANPRYAPTGHIVYATQGTLRAVAFDPDRLEVTGSPFPVLDEVNQKTSGSANFAISRNGTLVYNPTGAGAGMRQLSWVDREGRVEHLDLPPGQYDSPALSPDGKHLALVIRDESGAHIWVYDLARKTLGKRTFEQTNRFPIWTPDGHYIVYSTGATGLDTLMRVPADGSGSPEPVLASEQVGDGVKVPTSWSPDDQWLLIQRGGAGAVWKARLDGSEAPGPIFETDSQAAMQEARFSPDGRWITYKSAETGRIEIFAQPFPGPGGKWQISNEGGGQAMWSSDGREIFFKSGDRMMAVDVQTEPTFQPGTPRVLFEKVLPERVPGDPSRYGVSPDGQRFLIISPAERAADVAPAGIYVVMNWFQELRDLAPASN